MQAAIDRRTFVAGSATGAAVSALMGIGLTRAQAEEASAANGEQVPEFLIPPDPATPDKTADYDVVVVGAGFSGLNCAFSAAQNGANVCLIERLDQVIGRGGSTFAINSKLMDEKGYHYTTGMSAPEHDDEKRFDIGRVFKRMMGYHSYRIDGAKWMLHAHRSEEAMNWMIDNMTTASKVGGYDLTPVMEHWYSDPEGINGEFPGTHEFLDGPNGSGPAANPQQDACENLLFYCQDAGVDVHFGTVAQQLVKDGERVVGVICQDPDGTITQYNGAKGIVMCTGDFGTNQEMKEAIIPWMKDVPGGIWEGTGHKMCYWAGAAVDRSGTPAPMVFCFQWRSITKQVRAFQGLMVNSDGVRYTNEDNVISHGGLSLMHERGHQAFAIWDDDYANEPQWQNHAFVDGDPVFADADEVRAYWDKVVNGDGYVEMNGSGKIEVRMIKADTVEELVEQLGLPAEETLAQIERYNKYCDQGFDEEFDKRPELLLPVKTAPFYGIKCTPWFLTTTGGIRCNERMQVQDADDNVIPGLYCLGSMVGDMYDNCYSTHFPGHNLGSTCLTFGYLTGKYLATEAE